MSAILLVIILIAAITEIKWLVCIGVIAEVVFSWILEKALDKLNTNGQSFKLLWHSVRFYNKNIRLSFSYLFKISIDGKYLLVRGNRLKNQYQPIGGVYKYYDEAKSELGKMEYRPDVTMGNTDETDDLRITIKGKHLLHFMDWFLSMEDREYDPYREFKEELLDSNLIPEENFRVLKYRKDHIHNEGITFSTYNNCWEYIYADIFELKLSKEQEATMKQAVDNNSEMLCLATDIELETECYAGREKNIGNNAKWLIGG